MRKASATDTRFLTTLRGRNQNHPRGRAGAMLEESRKKRRVSVQAREENCLTGLKAPTSNMVECRKQALYNAGKGYNSKQQRTSLLGTGKSYRKCFLKVEMRSLLSGDSGGCHTNTRTSL